VIVASAAGPAAVLVCRYFYGVGVRAMTSESHAKASRNRRDALDGYGDEQGETNQEA
jgi:hypothetical protein